MLEIEAAAVLLLLLLLRNVLIVGVAKGGGDTGGHQSNYNFFSSMCVGSLSFMHCYNCDE